VLLEGGMMTLTVHPHREVLTFDVFGEGPTEHLPLNCDTRDYTGRGRRAADTELRHGEGHRVDRASR
jgi:hypothetical protein